MLEICLMIVSLKSTILNHQSIIISQSFSERHTKIYLNICLKWHLLKLKSFCKAKDMVNKIKWQPTEWEKIFTNSTSDRFDL